MKQKFSTKLWLNALFIIMTAIFIIPFLILIMISISNEQDVLNYGYKIIPMHFSLEAYKTVFSNVKDIAWSSFFTIIVGFVNTFFAIALRATMGYTLSRPDYDWKNIINRLMVFTMLFGGGLIPTYILNTQYLKLQNTVWVYIFPGIFSAWGVIIYRTFFKQIPISLIESARLDGASETRILVSIMIPLTKQLIFMSAFQGIMGFWNSWETSLYYITKRNLYTIQYLLQIYLNNAEEIKKVFMDNPQFAGNVALIPTETLRFAMAAVATIPVLILFPFFQRYFSKGINVGAVKG